jgi:hypothetical protein
VDDRVGQVDVIPSQRQEFALPHARLEREEKECPVEPFGDLGEETR